MLSQSANRIPYEKWIFAEHQTAFYKSEANHLVKDRKTIRDLGFGKNDRNPLATDLLIPQVGGGHPAQQSFLLLSGEWVFVCSQIDWLHRVRYVFSI